MNKKNYYVYILASKRNGTLYTGVTSDLKKRIYQLHNLVYYEQTPDVCAAIKREKNLKNWKRKWKLLLIEKTNPEWKDLYCEL